MESIKGYMRHAKILSILTFLLCGVAIACSKEKKDEGLKNDILINLTATPLPTMEPLPPTESPGNESSGSVKSKLTGLPVTPEEANKRPFAVMYNNIKIASPQSGIGDAAILYEALVEGGITRLMGIYGTIAPDSETAARMGSIRSARHYYVSFADEYDALFIHYGETTYAAKKMKNLGIDHITGMYGIGAKSFYRDSKIRSPHNAFISLDGILKGIKAGNIRTEYEEGYKGHFNFYEEDTNLTDEHKVKKLTLKFSSITAPYFLYDYKKKEYIRYQFGEIHKDANTGNALSFKNLIVQFVKEWDIDKNGYQTMDLEDSKGKGFYITNGKVTEITWKKNEKKRWMRYYDKNGDELTINPGKTYIAVFPDSKTANVVWEE